MSSSHAKEPRVLVLFTFSDWPPLPHSRSSTIPTSASTMPKKKPAPRPPNPRQDLAYFFFRQLPPLRSQHAALSLLTCRRPRRLKPKTAHTVAYLMVQTLMQPFHISQHEYSYAFGDDAAPSLRTPSPQLDYRFPPLPHRSAAAFRPPPPPQPESPAQPSAHSPPKLPYCRSSLATPTRQFLTPQPAPIAAHSLLPHALRIRSSVLACIQTGSVPATPQSNRPNPNLIPRDPQSTNRSRPTTPLARTSTPPQGRNPLRLPPSNLPGWHNFAVPRHKPPSPTTFLAACQAHASRQERPWREWGRIILPPDNANSFRINTYTTNPQSVDSKPLTTTRSLYQQHLQKPGGRTLRGNPDLSQRVLQRILGASSYALSRVTQIRLVGRFAQLQPASLPVKSASSTAPCSSIRLTYRESQGAGDLIPAASIFQNALVVIVAKVRAECGSGSSG